MSDDRMSDDDLMLAIMGMRDLGGQERQIAQQQALANQLRGQAMQPVGGAGWAGGLTRVMQGLGSGAVQSGATKGYQDLDTQKTEALAKIRKLMLQRRAASQPRPPMGVSPGGGGFIGDEELVG